MKNRFRLIPDWLKRLLTAPTAELSRWQYAARFFLELCRHGVRQLRQDRASQMAAALAFRTIFGVVPVIVIAMLLFRAFGEANLFANLVDQMLSAAKLDQVESPDKALTLAAWTRSMIQDIDAKISGRAIGVIGALVLGWAAIGLLTTIERSFNTICQTSEHRSLIRRIPLYWTTITIGPVLLYLSFRFGTRLVERVEQAGWGAAVASTLGVLTAFLSVWLLLLSLYKLMPYARVNLTAAAAGSFVAAVFWTAATNLFGLYIAWSFSKQSSAFTILYGSLGLIPLFLLWVYFLWLVVLYGLEITSMLQIVGGRMDKGMPVRGELPPMVEPAGVIPLMQVVAERFDKGLSTEPEHIVEATRFNRRAVDVMLAALTEEILLHFVDRGAGAAYALARPPDRITTGELLRIAQRLTDSPAGGDSKAWEWVREFRVAQLQLTLHKPLAEI